MNEHIWRPDARNLKLLMLSSIPRWRHRQCLIVWIAQSVKQQNLIFPFRKANWVLNLSHSTHIYGLGIGTYNMTKPTHIFEKWEKYWLAFIISLRMQPCSVGGHSRHNFIQYNMLYIVQSTKYNNISILWLISLWFTLSSLSSSSNLSWAVSSCLFIACLVFKVVKVAFIWYDG